VLLEACVEGSRPDASSKAAGWQCLGRTASWLPSKRPRLPGDELPWQAYVQMRGIARFWPSSCAP